MHLTYLNFGRRDVLDGCYGDAAILSENTGHLVMAADDSAV